MGELTLLNHLIDAFCEMDFVYQPSPQSLNPSGATVCTSAGRFGVRCAESDLLSPGAGAPPGAAPTPKKLFLYQLSPQSLKLCTDI